MATRMITDLQIKEYEITPECMKDLQAELAALKESRDEAAHDLREISSQSNTMGVREDSTFIIMQNRATELDGRIDHLERIIGLAKIIQETPKDNVGIGSKVSVETNGEEQQYMVVSPLEADPDEGKISHESPVGKALLNKKVKDMVEVMMPNENTAVMTITAIA